MIPKPYDYDETHLTNALAEEKRRAWWLWHFAGLLMAARVAEEGESHEQSAEQAALGAEALILELEE